MLALMRTAVGFALLVSPFAALAAQPQERIRRAVQWEPAQVQLVVHRGFTAQEYVDRGTWAISPLGAGLGEMLHSRRVRKQEPSLAMVRAALQELDLEAMLESAVRNQLVSSGRVDASAFEAVDPADVENDVPQGTLRLMLEHYLTFEFRTLRVRLVAEHMPVCQGNPCKPDYYQVLFHETRAPSQSWGARDDAYMAHWAGMAPEAIRGLVATAVDDLAADLAADIPLAVRLGMREGPKQHGFRDGPLQNYGVVVKERDGRQWLRLRNGFLVNTTAKQ